MSKSLLFTFLLGASASFGQTTIWSEDFQSGIPTTWELNNLDGLTPDSSVSEYTAAFISKLDPADTSNINLTASSTSYFSPVGTANRWLITPSITLGAYGNAIEWKAKSHDASYPESYRVLVSTTDTSPTSFTETIGNVILENADWVTRTADLSAFNNQTIYVAFVLETFDGFKLYLDDVTASKEDPVGLEEKSTIDLSLKTLDQGIYEINSELEFDKVSVHDAMGRMINSSTSKIIDLQNETPGIFFIHARFGNDLFVSKIVR